MLTSLPLLMIILTSLNTIQWNYYGEVVKPFVVKANNIKDPEFFRLPDHSLYRDEEGYYYIVCTAHLFPAILKTKDFKKYKFITKIPLVGKVAPFIIYDNESNKFYMFYSDWRNIVKKDIIYARLGLAIGVYKNNTFKFEDKGYINILNSPLPSGELGWDPYIVKINNTFYMLYSAARHGVHIARAASLGKNWSYVGFVTLDERENPALFKFNKTWYMLIGIYYGEGYDLYSSTDFLHWKLEKRNWFKDPEYPILPSGSTCALINNTLYHLYQIPLSNDLITGAFSLKLAFVKLKDP